MDPRPSDRKLCVSLSSAPEVTARRHTDHATICRFADCVFFRAPRGKTSGVFVFRTVPGTGDDPLSPRRRCETANKTGRFLDGLIRPASAGGFRRARSKTHENSSRAVRTRRPRRCIHILMGTLCARSDVGNHTPLCSVFQVIAVSRA